MATAKQQKSGKWRCQAYLGKDKNGKLIMKSVTADTKSEAEKICKLLEATGRASGVVSDKNMTVSDALDMFISQKDIEVEKGLISPTTVKNYKGIVNNNIDAIKDIPIIKINDKILNQWIMELYDTHSAKTCKNCYSLVHSALMDVLPRSTVIDWRVKIPTISKKKVYVPTEEDIMKVLAYFKDNDYDMYIACLLASIGTLRRSELCAVTADDIDGNIISINKALVINDAQEWVLKSTKTELSTREVVVPQFLIELLPSKGNLVSINPNTVTGRFRRCLKKLDIEDFRFHDLRHYSASIMHELGASNEIIMKRGGWANDFTLNNHYRGVMSDYEMQFTEKLNLHFLEKFGD